MRIDRVLMGESKGYFLLGIWTSLVWAAVFALSVLIRRPVVGYIWGWVNDHDRDWRAVRRAVLAFDIATMVWVLVFASRFVVQQHLYDADQTGWLGVARIAMGWPLTAVAALVTYLAIRAAQRAVHAHHDARAVRPPRNTERESGRGSTGCPLRRTADVGVAPATPTGRSSRSRCWPPSSRSSTAPWSTWRCLQSDREFGGGLALQQWVVDGYLLTLGALILVAGAISDQFGRRQGAAGGHRRSSRCPLCCARWRPTGWVLVAARCLQGVGAAFLVPSSLAMINARFTGTAQARAIGTWTAWTGTAFVVGPAARRGVGRRGGLAVDLRGQHRAAGRHALSHDDGCLPGEFAAEDRSRRSMSSARR